MPASEEDDHEVRVVGHGERHPVARREPEAVAQGAGEGGGATGELGVVGEHAGAARQRRALAEAPRRFDEKLRDVHR